jgi:hypothetical protein
VEGERERSDAAIAEALEKLGRDKTRPTLIHVWAPVPARGTPIALALLRLRTRRAEVRWTLPSFEESVGATGAYAGPTAMIHEPMTVAEAVDVAVRARALVARERGERALRRLGVRPQRTRRRALPKLEAATEPRSSPEATPGSTR